MNKKSFIATGNKKTPSIGSRAHWEVRFALETEALHNSIRRLPADVLNYSPQSITTVLLIEMEQFSQAIYMNVRKKLFIFYSFLLCL
jgi:hypothetical protein